MPRCDECGREYDTERGVSIHRTVEHDDDLEEWEGDADTVLATIHNPRYMFFFGFLVGLVVIGMVVFSSAPSFQGEPEEIGRNTVAHYERTAPPGVTYDLMTVEEHDSGLYAVTLQVTSGNTASNQTVYASPDGGYLFESSPVTTSTDISAFSR